MTYPETVEYLFSRLPMFSRIGADAFKKDLTNTYRLCEALGNPQQHIKMVHIAGTNGKGSTSHMLAAILQEAGYKTGLYTSPHLKDFRERIKINGEWCDEAFVVDFTRRIQPYIDSVEPSFFEITVAMAFDYFAQQKVDIAVIETGLGGRLDSTNIITPELSVITNIGMDHMNMLGDTLTLIAEEKAGIIKKNIPVVIGEAIAETRPVFETTANALEAPIIFAQECRYVTDWKYQAHHLHVEVADRKQDTHHIYELDLPGIYQRHNLLTVLEAAHQLQLQGWNIGREIVHKALKQVKRSTGLHGRWEIVREQPLVVLDVAHNADGIKQVREQLEYTDYHHLHIVIGMVKDKDVEQVLEHLPQHASYYFTRAQLPRAMDALALQELAAAHQLHGEAYATVELAVREALTRAHEKDMILVCGSVFVVAEVSL
ncbi:bifunctional folylpolyglutamate synthase/dihydrofolate synthase [Sediminibacterium ginsengisoli]|uniref:Dihydrofolate synthase/folylpolyglutamate synthase n=1 Tax=Sediminibacterium ginsengisoli TaxID=413434 RepID=A0A1T4P495_9BACT|nr:folylpolyglutamate synthase/dihydrofolate synthase family protein [Sediminibacterium ginsengisoli]SJZ86334.1 dihydrofolate synthase / folylpolyglutamate synthase [Sediminibacterium ginsengisoli]